MFKRVCKSVRDWLVAIIFLLIVAITWLGIIVVMSPVMTPVYIISLFKEELVLFGKKILFKSWHKNMLISGDQGANTLLGGSMDNHVSGRVGYNAILGNGVALKMEIVIDLIFKVLFKENNHSRNAIERDENYNKHWGG
jgi:hypothetical protein